jgi:CRISPR/Cas system-associated exonuclease Cas4 (RecB family)
MFIHEKIEIGYDDLIVENGANGRRYLSPEGNKYPSITTVLGVLSRAGIAAWRARVGDEEANKISHRASTRGTAVHDIVEKYLDNEELPEVLPHITASLSNLKPSLSRIGRIFAQESPLYSKHLGVAGRVDCVGEYDGVPSIIDFKTSKKIKKKEWITSYFMQAAAYAIMWEERTGMPITNLVIIMDVDNESPQIYVEHRDNWTEKLFETIELYHKEQRQRPL